MAPPLKLTLALTDGKDAVTLGVLEIEPNFGNHTVAVRNQQLASAVADLLEDDKSFERATGYAEQAVAEYLAAQA